MPCKITLLVLVYITQFHVVSILNFVLKWASVPKLNNRKCSEVGAHVPKCTVGLGFSFK